MGNKYPAITLVIQILKRSMDKPVDPMNRDCDSV